MRATKLFYLVMHLNQLAPGQNLTQLQETTLRKGDQKPTETKHDP